MDRFEGRRVLVTGSEFADAEHVASVMAVLASNDEGPPTPLEPKRCRRPLVWDRVGQ